MVSSISSAGGLSSSYISQMQEKMLKAIDTNADGSVSKDEFMSNRPKEVSEDQASEMWSRLDTSDSGILTGSEFVSAMQSQGPPPGPPPGGLGGQDGSDESSSTESSSSSISSGSDATANNGLVQALLAVIEKYTSSMEQNNSTSNNMGQSMSDLFGKIDLDRDGSVSKDEFVSNRPEGVSEDQANEMWSRLDTSNGGSLSESQFVSAMKSQGLPPGPPPGGFDGQEGSGVSSSNSSSSRTSSSSGATASSDLVQALLAAIKEYTSPTGQYDSQSNVSSSLAASVSILA